MTKYKVQYKNNTGRILVCVWADYKLALNDYLDKRIEFGKDVWVYKVVSFDEDITEEVKFDVDSRRMG